MDDITRLKALQFVDAAFKSHGDLAFPVQVDRMMDTYAKQQVAEEYMTLPEVLEGMRESLEKLLQERLDPDPPRWDRNKYLAYLLALGPLHFHKVVHVLKEVMKVRDLTRGEAVRVLDVGAGPGIGTWSILFFFELWANALDMAGAVGQDKQVFVFLNYLDKNEDALDLYPSVVYSYVPQVPHFGYDIGTRLQLALKEETRVVDLLGEEQYDLILFSHVLSELKGTSLERKAQMIQEFGANLSDHGALILIDSPPKGGLATANQLRSRIVAKNMLSYGPCSSLAGPPTGPICLTCGSSQKDHVHGLQRTGRFLKQLSGPTLEGLISADRWVWSAFLKDGAAHHGELDTVRGGAGTIQELIAGDTDRTTMAIQIARREDQPFLHYKVCDQSSKIEDCYLTFEPSHVLMDLRIGEVLRLENIRVDRETRSDGPDLKNKIYLVVDDQTVVTNITASRRLLPTSEVFSAP